MQVYGAIINARYVDKDLYEIQLHSGYWLEIPVTWDDIRCWDGFVYVDRGNCTEAMSKETFETFAMEAENLAPVIDRIEVNYEERLLWED